MLCFKLCGLWSLWWCLTHLWWWRWGVGWCFYEEDVSYDEDIFYEGDEEYTIIL